MMSVPFQSAAEALITAFSACSGVEPGGMSKSPGRIMPSRRLRGSGAARTPSAAHSTTPSAAGSAVSATFHSSSAVKQSLTAVERNTGRLGDLRDVAGHHRGRCVRIGRHRGDVGQLPAGDQPHLPDPVLLGHQGVRGRLRRGVLPDLVIAGAQGLDVGVQGGLLLERLCAGDHAGIGQASWRCPGYRPRPAPGSPLRCAGPRVVGDHVGGGTPEDEPGDQPGHDDDEDHHREDQPPPVPTTGRLRVRFVLRGGAPDPRPVRRTVRRRGRP